jgi:hypothetical protein
MSVAHLHKLLPQVFGNLTAKFVKNETELQIAQEITENLAILQIFFYENINEIERRFKLSL